MILLIFILISQFLFFSYLTLLWFVGESVESREMDYSTVVPEKSNFQIVNYNEDVNLSEISSRLEELKIGHIYLIHGTFVGDDPFDIVTFIETAFPSLSGTIIHRIREQVKKGNNLIARELGNFHPNFLNTLKEISPKDLNLTNFTWSSSNHHIARLRGTLLLMRSIANSTAPGERVLMYGHSHAGQLFTLLSQILGKSVIANQLKEVLYKRDTNKLELEKLIRECRNRKYDFVTLGSPIRYNWDTSTFPKSKLIHVINHRGPTPLGGGLTSSITTRNGDYIQQWGVAGSDTKSPVREDNILNEELDLILGTGRDVSLLRKNIKFKKRLHSHGEHLLVDFLDSSKIPNSFLTIFGHGVYTKKGPMLWIINNTLKKLK